MSTIDFYEKIDHEGIIRMVKDRQEENLNLDFKCPAIEDMDRNDRKILAKAISGFANSSGGIIIWGVDARPNTDGVDCATDVHPIEDTRRLLAALNEHTGTACSPTVDGIRHKAVTEGTKTRGFAITFVPESGIGPHMAKFGEDRYYKRAGASFYKMEHFDIADMFGRRQRSELKLEYTEARKTRGDIDLWLANRGRSSALAPFLRLRCPNELSVSIYGVDGNLHWNLPILPPGSGGVCFGGRTDFAIHPGVSIKVCIISLKDRQASLKDRYSISYEVASNSEPLRTGLLQITVD